MNKKHIILSICMIVMVGLFMAGNAFASQEEMSIFSFVADEEQMDILNPINDSAPEDHAPAIGEFQYDSEYAALVAQKEQLATAYYNAKMSGNNTLAAAMLNEINGLESSMVLESNMVLESDVAVEATSRRLAIYQVPQETNFWCGYAAIKSLLDYEGISKTQTKIAGDVYSTTADCPWYLSNGNSRDQFPVPTYLTNQTGFYYVPYPYGAAGTTNVQASDISPKIVSTIDNGYGLVSCGISYGNISGHASILPGYPAKQVGHWLAIDGYKSSGNEIWIIDPAKSSAVSWSGSIDAYYSVTTSKLAAYTKSKGIVW